MGRNKLVLYVHFVWATWGREALITPEIERRLFRCIASEAQKLGCKVLALNGIVDHVHVVVKLPSTVCIAVLVKQMKGASSHFANETLCSPAKFKWQGGYGVFTVSRWDLPNVIGYVRRQKEHHAAGKLWQELEEIELG